MKNTTQILSINYLDLNEDCRTAKPKDIIIKASNFYILFEKVNKFLQNIHVNSYNLVNKNWEYGNNHPINSGAYLWELLEEQNLKG